MLSEIPAASIGPRSCRATTPCPTMTSRPPTGRAAALQPGQVAGRAAAHVGICVIQGLIPSALAMNLSVLRVCSIGREARRRGTRPGQRTTLSVAFLLLRGPSLHAPRRDGHHARLAGRPGGSPPATASPPCPSRRRTARGRGRDEHREAGSGVGYAASATRLGNSYVATTFGLSQGSVEAWWA